MIDLDAPREYAMIDDFLLDCVVREEHLLESEITEFDVEDGSDLTDNIRAKQRRVTMEGIVSNSPIGEIVSKRADPNAAAEEAFALFEKIHAARKPVTIRTSLKTYESMALENVSMPRSAENGDALVFTAQFRQIRIVANTRGTRVAIPIALRPKTVTKALIGPNAASDIAIDTATGKWLDPKINEWRLSAVIGTRVGSGHLAIEGDALTPAGHWRLWRGKPDSVDQELWDNNTIDQNRAFERNVVAIRNRGNKPFADAETSESLAGHYSIIVVPASQTHLENV